MLRPASAPRREKQRPFDLAQISGRMVANDRSNFLRHCIKRNRLLQCSKGLILVAGERSDPRLSPALPKKEAYVVHNERISELLPLEERIRRMGGERSFALGVAIGEALLKVARVISSRPARSVHSLGERVAAGD